MRKMLVATLFVAVTLVYAVAQQPGGTLGQNGAQSTSPSAQAPGTNQTIPATPGSTDQNSDQTPGAAVSAPITEGCLGGSNPNFTITDSTGTTYKLVIPPNADASSLNPHVGESVQVMGDVKKAGGTNSINVSRIGRGMGKCPASGSGAAQKPPSQ